MSIDDPWENDDDDDEYDDDDGDEESINARDWNKGYWSKSYVDMSEEEQWDNDHPMGESYKETKENDEIYGTNSFEEWREYRDEKVNSDDPELFPSYHDWLDRKENNEEE